MSDIVKRLRSTARVDGVTIPTTDVLHLEAADEIERLRKIEAAAIKSRTTDEYGLLSVEAGWELDKALNPSEETNEI